jgi:nitrite reductase/ring-hydroxylating ferredoxin subunit
MKKVHDVKNDRYGNDDEFHYLCQANDIALGNSKSFSIKSKKGHEVEIAVFNVQEKYYAISNICKHVGGPLSRDP